ncbi:MAG: hypothetical protein K8J09_22195 [Planctomycetes bacterium]|nr:hypothetical protein [Planctomycetota bacterium]MCC7399648.1 hypothetical protein [Planctomycetota bacterium]
MLNAALLLPALLSPNAGPGDYLVVRVALDAARASDRGYLAAAAKAAVRHHAITIDWDGDDFVALDHELQQRQPENVLFVLRPESLDVLRHRRILLLASKVDDDWFVDFAFGYLTAADGQGCERLWQHIEQRRERDAHGGVWIDLAVASMDRSAVYSGAVPELAKAAGFRGDQYYFGTGDAERETMVARALAATATADVLHFSGNGDPEGIWLFPGERNRDRDKHWPYAAARVGEDKDGAMPRLLAQRFRALTWNVPILWSGTCHSGAVDRVFVEGDIVSTFGRTDCTTVHRLAPTHSLALSWLAAGAAGLIVPIAANHGLSASMEIDFTLQHGSSLGEAIKSTWDDVLLQAEGKLVLDFPVEGEPHRRGEEKVMQGGGANRVLIGDPALRPFAATPSAAEQVVAVANDGGATVTVTRAAGWAPRGWDMYGVDRTRDWRVLVRVDLDALGLAAVPGFAAEVKAATPDGQDLPFTLQRCAIEHHAGRTWLHLQANAARAAVERKAARVVFTLRPR